MTLIYYILIAGAALAVILTASAVISKEKKKRFTPPYTEALHCFIEGDRETALELLKKAVKTDTENIMAYVLLGNILREQGNPQKAIKVHKNLLVRSNLTKTQTREILSSLIRDYKKAGLLVQAVDMAEQLVKQDKKNTQYQEILLSLYEESKSWDKAFFQRQNINRWNKHKTPNILALYKVEAGLDAVKAGMEKEARIRFKEALKLNKKCIPAYLLWGDSLRREGRDPEAFEVWATFTKKNPKYAYLAFDKIRDLLFDLGRYGETEIIYREVISRNPDNFEAQLNLAELHMKQGDIERAAQECQNLYEKYPGNKKCGLLLINLLRHRKQDKEAFQTALELLKNDTEEAVYTCSACGFKTKKLIWHCPSCGAWDSFLGGCKE
ncbi:tetratricopeptide repeat protein [bacterium]|nr:tetratricopeptide repeat protein [bacterium]